MHYKKGFYLTGKKGNSAFGDSPRLYVAPIITGDLDDLKVGDEVAFEDFDEGVLKSCKGLKNFVRTSFNGVPVVIFDNHNHAFYFWMEGLLAGLFGKGVTVIHVDQHKDTRKPEKGFDGVVGARGVAKGELLKDAFLYTNEVLNVGNYIEPAVGCGVVGDVIFVQSGKDLQNLAENGLTGLRAQTCKDCNNRLNHEYILNLDMDFFAPEMGVDFARARDEIRELANGAKLITAATSPFFIEQKLAIDLLKRLL